MERNRRVLRSVRSVKTLITLNHVKVFGVTQRSCLDDLLTIGWVVRSSCRNLHSIRLGTCVFFHNSCRLSALLWQDRSSPSLWSRRQGKRRLRGTILCVGRCAVLCLDCGRIEIQSGFSTGILEDGFGAIRRGHNTCNSALRGSGPSILVEGLAFTSQIDMAFCPSILRQRRMFPPVELGSLSKLNIPT